MNEIELNFEVYQTCSSCDGHGGVWLHGIVCDEKLKKYWEKQLEQDYVYEGYNVCNKCQGSGLELVSVLKDLELLKDELEG